MQGRGADMKSRDKSRRNSVLTVVIAALLAVTVLTRPAVAITTLVVNPDPLSGNFTPINNGSFESNTGNGGTMTGWSDQFSFRGVWRASDEQSLFGGFSAKSIPSTNSINAGFTLEQAVPTIAGASYMLSAFFYFDEITTARLYVDTNDQNDPDVGFFSVFPADTWVLAYDSFIAPSASTTIRLVMDGNVTTDQFGFIDGVGVTLLQDFVAAQAIAEPASLALLGIGLAGLGLMRRRRPA